MPTLPMYNNGVMTTDTSIHANDTDKFLYVGLNATFVTVNGCYFGGHKYGLILGYPGEDGANSYDGYPCMTIANNYFRSTITRAPGLMRYGYFHCYNNYGYATRNASDAKTWAMNYCGSKSSSLSYAID